MLGIFLPGCRMMPPRGLHVPTKTKNEKLPPWLATSSNNDGIEGRERHDIMTTTTTMMIWRYEIANVATAAAASNDMKAALLVEAVLLLRRRRRGDRCGHWSDDGKPRFVLPWWLNNDEVPARLLVTNDEDECAD